MSIGVQTVDVCLVLVCSAQAVPHEECVPRPGPGSLPVGPPSGLAALRAKDQTSQQAV